jgi:type IX secretion system PorP/SprF family membrane protein
VLMRIISRKTGVKKHIICFMLLLSALVNAQQSPLFTQYSNHPLLLNPAYAGNRNSLAMDIYSRQQWIGLKNAPATYYIGAHAPINETMMSVGGTIMSDHAGPMMHNQLSLVYAYLLKINHSAFISFGLNVGVNNYWLALNKLDIIDITDPLFMNGIQNSFRPLFGTGFLFYTQTVDIGVSIPQMFGSRIAISKDDEAYFKQARQLLLYGALNFGLGYEYNLKFSTLNRLEEIYGNTHDISAILKYTNFIKAGVSYRIDHSAALLFGMQVTENIGFTYSYDFALTSKTMNPISFQELTITYDYSKFIFPNRDREFSRKRRTEDINVRSIRYF